MEKKIEQIVIDVPKDKTASQKTEGNKIIIEFTPKKKTFEDYTEEYRIQITKQNSFRGVSVTSAGMDNWLEFHNPIDWPLEFRYGLLRYIANELSGPLKKEQHCTAEINIIDNDGEDEFSWMRNSCNYLGEIWSRDGAIKATKIIPIDFYKSLLPVYS